MKIVGYKFFSKSYKIDPKKLTGMMGSVSFKFTVTIATANY